MPRGPDELARELLGAAADEIEPLLVWSERATHRVTVGSQCFVVKTDDDHQWVAREAAGQQRAAAAGIPVPEVVAVGADAFAMRWVDGVTLNDHSTPAAWADTGAHVRTAHDLDADAPFGAGFGGYGNAAYASWREFFRDFAESQVRSCERELGIPVDTAERVRIALRDSAPALDAPHLGWCHGDFQPQHVLVDPTTDRVAAIIDWADHGTADVGWDVMVVTLDDDAHLDAFLTGYGADDELRAALAQTMPFFRVVRLLGEAGWLAEHGLRYADSLNRAINWRA